MIRWLRWVVARGRFEREMRDEMRAHVEHRADDLARAGVSREEALRRARVEFGALEAWKEECRDASGFLPLRPLHGLRGDLKLAVRRLAATPVFTVFAVLSLGLALGVTTAVYSALDTFVWQRPLFGAPARVAFVASSGDGQHRWRSRISYPDFVDLQDGLEAGTLAASATLEISLATGERAEVVQAEAVSGDYFHVLGVSPAIGRPLDAEDTRLGRHAVLLGHEVWRDRFDSDPAVAGRVIRLNGRSFEVAGVMPPRFHGLTLEPVAGTGLWLPLSAGVEIGTFGTALQNRERRILSVALRLPAGSGRTAVSDRVEAIGRALDTTAPVRGDPRVAAAPRQWTLRTPDELRASGPDVRLSWLIAGIVALVLAVACSNLANLMLARGWARHHEFAVRRALGASRWRLIRELLGESSLIALAGGLLDVAVTVAILSAGSFDLPTPRGMVRLVPELSVTALVAAAAALLLSLFVFGLEPALQLTRRNVTPDLARAPGDIGGPSQGRQRGLLRWQVAISTCFFLIAAVLGRVMVAEWRHDTGIDLDRLSVVTVNFKVLGWEAARSERALDAALAEIRRQPGMQSASASVGMPFGTTSTAIAGVSTPDRSPLPGQRARWAALYIPATPDVFRTLGIEMVRGRAWDARDERAGDPPVVVSASLARTEFGTLDVVGRTLQLDVWGRGVHKPFRIVGVSADTDNGRVFARNGSTAFVPLTEREQLLDIVIVARTTGDAAGGARLVQSSLRRVDPDFSTIVAGAGRQVLAPLLTLARIGGVTAVLLGGLTLLLSMVGLFGVQLEVVSRRTREVGVRMALGATAAQVQRMILGQGFRPVLQGMGLGLFFGVLCRFGIRAILEAPIAIVDPIAFTLIPVVLAAAAYAACWLPARRAASVEPNEALRHL